MRSNGRTDVFESYTVTVFVHSKVVFICLRDVFKVFHDAASLLVHALESRCLRHLFHIFNLAKALRE